MRRRIFLRRIGAAASLPLLWNNASVVAEPVSSSHRHRILTCNVRVDARVDAETGDSWADRREFCADVIKAQKADLIGLQEAQPVHVSYFKNRMPEYDSYAISNSASRFNPVDTILFLRSRYDLISEGGFWFSETPHVPGSKSWDAAEPRLVNWVHLKDRKSGKEFRFWNTHFDHKGQKAREHAASMLMEASAALPADLPQLLTGDLNAHAHNPAIEIIRSGGWSEIYEAVHGPAEVGFTAHGFRGAKNPVKTPEGKLKGRIDWIFARGPVKPIAAKVIRDSRNGHYPSDHYFVSAEVEL